MEVVLKRLTLIQMLRMLMVLVVALSFLTACKSGDKKAGAIPAAGEMAAEDTMEEEQPQEEGAAAPVVDLQRIHFDYDSYNIRGDAAEILTQTAQYLTSNPDVWIQVEGHCDERGSAEYNLALGEKRANASKDFLINLGVESKRISIISYGEEKALEYGSNEQAWSMNRRAEFVVVSKGM